MSLEAQITFLKELDALKQVIRQTILADKSRRENTAEHSWHVAMAAMTLAPHADAPVDTMHVVKMLLVHDIVEIDAGDTYAYDELGYEDKLEREQAAAKRLFGILPEEQGTEFRELWEEFEAAESEDAKFAGAIDQLMPFLHNIWSDGESWRKHRPPYEVVFARNQERVGGGSTELWAYVERLFEKVLAEGWLEKSE
ncbi:MAG: HD domain-containing protein [Aggregatilineales bacterium]